MEVEYFCHKKKEANITSCHSYSELSYPSLDIRKEIWMPQKYIVFSVLCMLHLTHSLDKSIGWDCISYGREMKMKQELDIMGDMQLPEKTTAPFSFSYLPGNI